MKKENKDKILEEVKEKLLRHFNDLEMVDSNSSFVQWRNYKFIRNNIVDVINSIKQD